MTDQKYKRYLNKLSCWLGWHDWKTPIVASLDTYWLQCGKECAQCNKYIVTKAEVSSAASYSYQRGKEHQCLVPKSFFELKGLKI